MEEEEENLQIGKSNRAENCKFSVVSVPDSPESGEKKDPLASSLSRGISLRAEEEDSKKKYRDRKICPSDL